MPPARNYDVWMDCLLGRDAGAGAGRKPWGKREDAAGDLGECLSGSGPVVRGNELTAKKEHDLGGSGRL